MTTLYIRDGEAPADTILERARHLIPQRFRTSVRLGYWISSVAASLCGAPSVLSRTS
jgi:hypothetical protein